MKKFKYIIALFCILTFSGIANAVDIQAGPIWNNKDAQGKCPGVCSSHQLTWNGNWTTTVPGKMSVCGCDGASAARDIEAGPIWSNKDAGGKCPSVCSKNEMNWNGQWTTTVQGKMSVCGCVPK
jgi:hypothetical protein